MRQMRCKHSPPVNRREIRTADCQRFQRARIVLRVTLPLRFNPFFKFFGVIEEKPVEQRCGIKGRGALPVSSIDSVRKLGSVAGDTLRIES
jgi:hypothetical protein